MKKVQVAMLAFMLAFGLMFVGCGVDDSPTGVAKEYFAAIQKGDMKKIEKLSPPKDVRGTITANGKIKLTPEQEAEYTKKMEELAAAFLKSFQEQLAGAVFTAKEENINGEKASVNGTLSKDGKDSKLGFRLVKINGEWKVESFN